MRCQPRSLNRRVTPRKSLQSSFYLGQPGSWGRRRDLSGFCVIVSPLIKVKGVSWIVSLCHRLLLDICCFQVEEMFKDWRVDLQSVPTTYYLTSARSILTDVTSTNFSHFTHTTAFIFFYFHGTEKIASISPYGFCFWQQQIRVTPFLNSLSWVFILSSLCKQQIFFLFCGFEPKLPQLSWTFM